MPRARLGRPWGTDFPNITIRDMVRAQQRLVAHLGIDRLLAVVGGSMGGMQVLEWAATFPDAVYAAAPIATAANHSAQNIAFNEVGRAAIHSDPDWNGGRYWEEGQVPAQGLSVARMVAHITYLSEQALTRKFGRRLRGALGARPSSRTSSRWRATCATRAAPSSRFDANSYLTITRAMDYFDLAAEHDGDLSAAFRGTRTRFFVASFSSDWLFPTAESRAVVRALNARRRMSPSSRSPRQGARRLPAGGTRLPPRAGRLPGRLRRPLGDLTMDDPAEVEQVFALAREGETAALRDLLAGGMPAGLLNARGDSLLMVAAYAGRQDAARLLLEHGADPGQPNAKGQLPIVGAAYQGDARMVALLLDHGAALDGAGADGRTALLTAALFDRAAVVELLLARGADPALADAKGMTPQAAARAMGARVTPALLERALGQA